jgi:hypothetical protein
MASEHLVGIADAAVPGRGLGTTMPGSRLGEDERAYRGASLGFDYFVTGLAALFFLVSLVLIGIGRSSTMSILPQIASVLLFALSLVAGIKKLEYFVAVLGSNYAITQAATEDAGGHPQDSQVLRDLHSTTERLSMKASLAHRLRNWSLVLGILFLVVSELLETLFA